MKIKNFSALLLLFALGSFSFISIDVKDKYAQNLGKRGAPSKRQYDVPAYSEITTVSSAVSASKADTYCWGYVVTQGTKNCYISNVVKVKYPFRANAHNAYSDEVNPESSIRNDVEKQFKEAVVEEYPNQKRMLGSTLARYYKTEAAANKYRKQELSGNCMKGEYKTIYFSYYHD